MRISSKKGRKKAGGSEAGLSLLEVLVGITILAVGLLAVAQMQITAIQGIDQSEEATVALNLAQEQLEDILNMDYNGGDLVDNNDANRDNLAGALITDAGIATIDEWDGLPAGGPDTVSTASGDFQIFWNVADNNNGTTQYKEVVVIVQWTRKNKTRTRTLSFVKSLAS